MKIYNTITRKKEEFVPIDPNEIKIYVCGPTVYNYIHIGNARPFVVFDTLRRYLEYKGYNVKYVQNFTDVDDKIINRAKETGVPPLKLSSDFIGEYYRDAGALNLKPASINPKVSENIDAIISFVSKLIEKGFAYEAEGDVYYSTRRFAGYGKLSGQNIDDLESGARVAVDERKRDPLDFALWKARKEESEPAWDSPWGMGRPGWHIECSAMVNSYLGDTIDIHAGGQDLMFPHHENEIAQSEAYSGKTFANYWMHNAYITKDRKKMAKSVGNFFTVREILKDFTGDELRYFLLSGHYRSPLEFNRDVMEQARNGLERIHNTFSTLDHLILNGSDAITDDEREKINGFKIYRERFCDCLDDDLNTADALSAVFELVREVNTAVGGGSSKDFASECRNLLSGMTDILGLSVGENTGQADDDIMALVEERQAARKEKNFARADEIRDMLKARGYAVEDTPQGPKLVNI